MDLMSQHHQRDDVAARRQVCASINSRAQVRKVKGVIQIDICARGNTPSEHVPEMTLWTRARHVPSSPALLERTLIGGDECPCRRNWLAMLVRIHGFHDQAGHAACERRRGMAFKAGLRLALERRS